MNRRPGVDARARLRRCPRRAHRGADQPTARDLVEGLDLEETAEAFVARVVVVSHRSSDVRTGRRGSRARRRATPGPVRCGTGPCRAGSRAPRRSGRSRGRAGHAAPPRAGSRSARWRGRRRCRPARSRRGRGLGPVRDGRRGWCRPDRAGAASGAARRGRRS